MSRQNTCVRASKRFEKTKDYKKIVITFSKRRLRFFLFFLILYFFFFFNIKQIISI